MTPVTPSQVFSKVSTESTLTHIRQTLLLTSTMLSVIRVLHLMTQVCSTAHMFPSRWFVPLERTPSSPRLDLRPATAWSQTHLQKAPKLVWVVSVLTATATTEELLLRTSCDSFSQGYTRGSSDPLFLCYTRTMNKPNWQHHSKKKQKRKLKPQALRQAKARRQALKKRLLKGDAFFCI